MGSKGGQTTTQNQTQTYNPAGASYITNALNTGMNAAQLPFTIPQAPVAGFSPDQQAAFGTVNQAQGMAQPYYNQASMDYSPSGAQQYFNPYADSVTRQMNNIFGQQQSQATGQLTQAAGGVGADRIAVGQGELANQQGLAAGQTFSNMWNNAVGQSQSAGAGQASLGNQAQNSWLQGAQAQLGTGGLQQQLSQAQMNSPYQQQLAQAAFPYQQAQFLAGITGSLAPGLGGTTNGTSQTTGPAASIWSQLLGLGTAGVGLAGGMGAFTGPNATDSYGGGSAAAGDAYGGSAQAPLPGLTAADYGGSPASSLFRARGGRTDPYYADGGPTGTPSSVYDLPSGVNDQPINVDAQSIIPKMQLAPAQATQPHLTFSPPPAQAQSGGGDALKMGMDVAKMAMMFANRGGKVDPKKFDGYNPYAFADGGDTGTVDDEPFRMPDAAAVNAWRRGVDADRGSGTTATDTGAAGPISPLSFTGADASPSLPPEITSGASASPYAPEPKQGRQVVSQASQDPAAPPEGKRDGFMDSPWAALMAAGLGIAGGTSPFAGVNIGTGSMQGLKMLQSQRENSQKDETIAQATRRLNQEAKFHEDAYNRESVAQKYKRQQDMLTPTPMIRDDSGKLIPNPAYKEMKEAENDLAPGKYTPGDMYVDKDNNMIPTSREASTGRLLNAITGEYLEPTAGGKFVNGKRDRNVNDEEARSVAEYFVQTGDQSRINALGLTSEARQAVQRSVAHVQKELGITNEDLATKVAEFAGRKAGQRTLAVMEAKMGSAAFEAEGAIKQARGIIEKLPRTSFLPLNELLQGYSKKTLNPDQTELLGRTQAIVNTYAAVMSRGANITTDSARGHATELLNTAGDPANYNRMLDTMLQEIEMAKHSPMQMREYYKKLYGSVGKASDEKTADAGAATLPPEALAKLTEGQPTTFGNGQVWTLKDGKPVKVK